MAPSAPWSAPISIIGPSSGGTTFFRHQGALHLTIVLKSTFSLVPDAPMLPDAPEELFRAEVHHRDNPTCSIRATSDVVPYLRRVDVVLTGHACAPAGETVTRQRVRLAVFRGHALLDKTLLVYGDRRGAEITPFERMPIVYERAFGGIGFQPNPQGTGKAPGSAPPNIVYPTDGSLVAGFGPISRALAQRKSLLGSLPRGALDQPVPELPADFDWAYFQSAPPDQQIDSLVGNEWIVLEGLHPELQRLSSRLPTARGIATVFGLRPDEPDAARSFLLRPDILRIDADALRCSLVFRTVVRLDDERALATLRIAGGVETEGRPVAHLLAPAALPKMAGTAGKATLPMSGDPAATRARDDARGRRGVESTVVLDEPSEPQAAMPFVRRSGGRSALERTLPLESAAARAALDKPVIPFAEAQSAAPSAPSIPIPGAPWSSVPVDAAPPLTREASRTLTFTIDLQEIDLSRPEASLPIAPPPSPAPEPAASAPAPSPSEAMEPAPVAPAPRAPEAVEPAASAPALRPAPEPPAEPAASASPPRSSKPYAWPEAPAEPKVELPKPPPPRIPPRQPVNRALYGGFGPAKKKG